MKVLQKILTIICIFSISSFIFIGCKKDGPAESAGKKIDEAIDSAKESIEDATE